MILVGLHQCFVFLTKLDQFIVGTHLDNTTTISLVLQDTNGIRTLDGTEAVGNDNGGSFALALFHESIETRLDNFLAFVVQGTRRFIQNEDLGVTQECCRYRTENKS